MSAGKSDWNPETYARFRGLRLRPALDLVAQLRDVPGGDVVDLGCGDGAAAGVLRDRCAGGTLIGVDASAAMLERASGYDQLLQIDAAVWQPERPPALIFSNAALHWLPDHARLLPRLAGFLAPGGLLAVQMPRQFFAPSHRFLRDIAASMFPDRFDFSHYVPPVATAVEYVALLAGLGQIDAWETEYVQRLDATEGMHPVRAFTASTAMRPFAQDLNAAEMAKLCAAYDASLSSAYPARADGSVLFPFRRLFFILKV